VVVSNRIAPLGTARETSLKFLVQKDCQHPRAGDGTTLFVTLWEFEVKPGSKELFERTYGPEGQWARLFRRDPRYRGTRLLRDLAAARVYVTMDMWDSRTAYEEFRKMFEAEYAETDKSCEGLTLSEKHLGAAESE
jgi:heme-degrading monooxygenase HmoA